MHGKLMAEIRKRILKVTNKPFTLDPNLGSMKNLSTQVTKDANWTLVCKELKKFNIKASKDQILATTGNSNISVVNVLQQLREYDLGLDGG